MTATDRPKPARRSGPRPLSRAAAASALLAAAVAAAAAAAPARAAIEDSYSPGEPPVSTTWFGPASAGARRADLDYIAGMRPHHAGALSMSREYLSDPGRSSPLLQALARAIVANQAFEIGMLDEVARNLDRPPVRLGPFGAAVVQPQATEGLAGVRRFFKEPVPGPLAYAVGPVSERDALFAKAMTIHHQAAVEMARGYQANADARNGYLGLMNVDIVTDQTQEIALMRGVVAAYPGDPDAVRVDPSMVHGMEGMEHGGHAPIPAGAAGQPRLSDHAGHGEDGHAHRGVHAGPALASEPPAKPPRPGRAPRSRPAPRQPAAGQEDHGHHHH